VVHILFNILLKFLDTLIVDHMLEVAKINEKLFKKHFACFKTGLNLNHFQLDQVLNGINNTVPHKSILESAL